MNECKKGHWVVIRGDDEAMEVIEEPTCENGGNIDLRGWDGTIHSVWVKHLQQLPTKRIHLQSGWELTGRAAKIDGTQELAENEWWVTYNQKLALDPEACQQYNQWRFIARHIV